MTTTTRSALIARAQAAFNTPVVHRGVITSKTDAYATVEVTLPDGTTGRADALAILGAAQAEDRGEYSFVTVWQPSTLGHRHDTFWLRQLA